MTSFELQQVFPGVSPAQLLAAFTDPAHQAAQDLAGDITRRDIVDRVNDATHYRCESWVFPRRTLPALLRPLVKGGLELHEIVTWDKATDALEIDVQPAILGGRSRIRSTNRVIADGTGARRIYTGTMTVDVALIGGRVEKAAVAELLKSLALAAETTRRWLQVG